MLEQLSDQIRQCFERSAEAKAQADATADPALKAEYLDMEKRWLVLARSYGFAESLGDFTEANSERRRKFEERLRANTRSASEIRADQFRGLLPLSNPAMTGWTILCNCVKPARR